MSDDKKLTRGWPLAAIALLLLSCAAASAWTPSDIGAYASRRAQCNHWEGEEPYDKPRRDEINRAMAKLDCNALDRDEKTLLRRYRSTPARMNQIRAAHDTLL